MNNDDIDEAREALDKMREAWNELDIFFSHAGGMVYERWKAYPRGHIQMAMSKEHDYLGSCPCDVQGLIDNVESAIDDKADCKHCGCPEVKHLEDGCDNGGGGDPLCGCPGYEPDDDDESADK